MSYGSAGSPRSSIASAQDSALSNASHYQYLAYDATTQKWRNYTLTVATFGDIQAIIDARIQSVTGYSASNGGGVSVSVVDGTSQATLSWTTATISGLTGWKVGRDGTDTDGSGAWSTIDPASASSRVFTKLTSGGSYTLSVAPVINQTVGTAVTVVAHPS